MNFQGEIGKAEVHLQRGESIDDEAEDEEDGKLHLEVDDPIDLSFATQYLKKFTAAGSLAKTVTVSLSKDVPMVICYEIEELGHLKYFLAPKIDDLRAKIQHFSTLFENYSKCRI